MKTMTSTLIALVLASTALSLPGTAAAEDLFAVDITFERVEVAEHEQGFSLTGGAKGQAPALVAAEPAAPAETEVAEAESAAG